MKGIPSLKRLGSFYKKKVQPPIVPESFTPDQKKLFDMGLRYMQNLNKKNNPSMKVL